MNTYRFPTWFFEIYRNIQSVTVHKIECDHTFIWFLKHCDRLHYLRFWHPTAIQPILDLLPKLHLPFGLSLMIQRKNGRQHDDLNYGPVFRIPRLEYLHFELELDLRIIQDVFSRLRFLKTLTILPHNYRSVEFARNSSGLFSIKSNSHNRINVRPEDLGEEIDWILKNPEKFL